MAKKKKVPELRFEGFLHEWELCSFNDLTYPSGEKNKNNFPYTSFSISNENGFFPQDEQFQNGGTMRNANKAMYSIVSPKSFAYNPARINVGSIGYYDSPKNVIVSSLYEVFKTTKRVDDTFLWFWFKTFSFRKIIEQYQEGGVRLYFFYDKLCRCQIALPEVEEQIKIGSIIQNIDKLIKLHQYRYDKLNALKKAMLEKMFPQKGTDVPEVRFKGFIKKWEKKKFKDNIISIQTGTALLGSINNSGMPLIKMGNIQRGYFSLDKVESLSRNDEIEKENIVNFGDFLFNTRNTLELVGKGATWVGESGKFAFNNNIARFTFQGIDTVFFNYLYNTQYLIKQVQARAMGTTSVAAVYPHSLNSIEYSLPSIEEQKQIGDFFYKLDSKILQDKRELDKLKKLNKAFLEKMFI